MLRNFRYIRIISFLEGVIPLKLSFITRGYFALPFHQGHLAMSGNIFGCHNFEDFRGWCYWHQVDGGQGCSWTFHNDRTSPTTNNFLAQNVNSAKVEKSKQTYWYYYFCSYVLFIHDHTVIVCLMVGFSLLVCELHVEQKKCPSPSINQSINQLQCSIFKCKIKLIFPGNPLPHLSHDAESFLFILGINLLIYRYRFLHLCFWGT